MSVEFYHCTKFIQFAARIRSRCESRTIVRLSMQGEDGDSHRISLYRQAALDETRKRTTPVRSDLPLLIITAGAAATRPPACEPPLPSLSLRLSLGQSPNNSEVGWFSRAVNIFGSGAKLPPSKCPLPAVKILTNIGDGCGCHPSI